MGDKDKDQTYCIWCCKCKNRYEILTWVNLFMALSLCTYAFFNFINIFAWFGGGQLFMNVVFPFYYA